MKTRRNGKMKGGRRVVPARAAPRAPPPPAARAPAAPAAAAPLLTVTNIQPVLDVLTTINKDMPSIAPNGPLSLLGPLQPLMAKIGQSISQDNSTFSAPNLAITQEDVKPVVDLYNSLTPALKAVVPKIIPPLFAPIFKVILPQAGFP